MNAKASFPMTGAAHAHQSLTSAGRRYRRLVLALLVVVAVFNYLDRQILSMLLEPIKHEFGLSDTQLGFLSGFAFSALYALFSIPLAKLADTSNRVALIAVVVALWSIMTVGCGLAVGFYSLLLSRMLVAVGESGSSPASQSLISDYFEPQQRATAMGIYATGMYFGILLGFLLGGWITDHLGWRTAFVVVGLPGLLVAAAMWFLVKEPRNTIPAARVASGPAPTLKQVYAFLWQRKALRYIPFAMGFTSCVAYGNLVWAPSFFIRSHHMSAAQVGAWLAVTAGLAGMAGAYFGGRITDHLVARYHDARLYMWVPVASMLLSIPFFLAVFLLPSAVPALLLFAVPWFLSNVWIGPTFALVQALAPPHMRGTAVATVNLINIIVGLGIGVQVIGIVGDALAPRFGVESLRYALIGTLVVTSLISTFCFWMASRTARSDLATP